MADIITRKTTTSGPVNDQDTIAGRLDYLKKYEDLLEDPKYAETAPADQRESLQAAIDRAKDTYSSEKRKNEWLEVAQMLGRAGTQFAAAAAGKDARDMSNLDFGKGIDYQGRTQSAFEEYRQATREAAGLTDANRQRTLDENIVKRSEFGKRSGMYKEGIDAMRDAERNRRLEESETRISGRQAKAEQQRGVDESYRRAEAVLRDQEKDLETEATQAQKVQDATTKLFNQLESEGASKKTVQAWEKQNPDVAKAAGIDLNKLQADLSKEETRPRILGGRSKDEDQAAKQDIVNQYKQQATGNLRDALDKLKAHRQKRQEMASGKLSPQEALQQSEPMMVTPKRDPQIEQYAKQYSLSYEQAQKVLESRGYQPAH